MSTPIWKLRPNNANNGGSTYSMTFCCDGIAVPLAALRAMSCRWVRNVVDAMIIMATTVTIFTCDGSAPNAAALDAVLKPRASGTPKTLAWPAVHNELGVQPY